MNSIHCPIIDLFTFLGKKWMIIIIKTLWEEDQQSFTQLQKKLDNINSRILTERLDEGSEKWYIIRDVSVTKPLKIRYSLTPRGYELSAKICELASIAKH